MGRQQVQRYKDVDIYVKEIEEVYDLTIEFEWGQNVSATTGCIPLVVKAWDMHDIWRNDGPLLYHVAAIPAKSADKRQKAIIRALTEITRQALEAYANRGTGAVPWREAR